MSLEAIQPQGFCKLNPRDCAISCSTDTTAAVLIALAVISTLVGVIAILASTTGLPLGPLNALSHLTVAGGSGLAFVGGMTLLTAILWIISKIRLQKEEKKTVTFTFPQIKRSYSHFKQVTFPDCFYSNVPGVGRFGLTDRQNSPVNRDTLVQLDHEYYPANYVSTQPSIQGQKGTTPYIIAAAPDSTNGPRQKELYYEMALSNNACCLFSVIPFTETARFPDFMKPGDQPLALTHGTITSCELLEFVQHPDKKECLFNVYQLKVEGREPIYQIVPNKLAVCKPLDFALKSVKTLKAIITKYRIPVKNAHPLIVNCHGGKDRSAATIMLFELLPYLENSSFEKLHKSIMNLARHIEAQTVRGGAVDWWEIL